MHTCYISYNAGEDIGYVGYELGSGDSYYYGSSDHPAFLYAKRHGKLKKYILGRFEKEFSARNAETFAIKKLREGGMNLYNRNEGGGGKDGMLGDYRTIDNSFRETVDNVISTRTFPDFRINSSRRKMADAAITKLENGDYIRFDEHISTLNSFISVQTRHTQINQVHVRNLYDSMVHDPVLFRSKTDPIIVVVDDREEPNKKYVLGGNHRIIASTDAGWDTFPTIYVNFSEFNYDMASAKLFGVHDNTKNGIHQKFLETEDIRVLIDSHRINYPEYQLTSYEFKQSFIEEYVSNQLSEKKLSINLANYIKRFEEKEMIALHNFHQYSDKELKTIKSFFELDVRFKDSVILSDEVTSLQYNGVGGICNALGKNQLLSKVRGRQKKTAGLIFARFKNYSEVEDEDVNIGHFENSMKIAGFTTLDERVWTNNEGYIVRLVILPWRHESNDSPVKWQSFKQAVDECLVNDKKRSSVAA